MTFHLQLEANTAGRDFVVGDVHGTAALLHEEMGRIDFRPERDRLISVGDLVDRGPDSAAAAALCLEPWFYAVRGNHEQLLLDVVDGADSHQVKLWRQNGGDWGLRWGRANALAQVAAGHCRTLPHVITLHHRSGWRVGICHAQCPVDDWRQIDAAEQDEALRRSMIWGRDRFSADQPQAIANIDLCIHGHTIISTPLQMANTLYIDTGAYRSGKLTVLCLDDWIAARVAPQ